MIRKSSEANNLQVKDHLSSLLIRLGEVVVAERLGDGYFSNEDCEIYLRCGYTQVSSNCKEPQ